MYCSQCGARCPEGARFCHICGSMLYQASVLSDPAQTGHEQALSQSVPDTTPFAMPEEPAAQPFQEAEEASTDQPDEGPALEAQEPSCQTEPEEPLTDLPEEIPIPTSQEWEDAPIPGSEEQDGAGKRSVRTALLVLLAMLLIGTLCHFLLGSPELSQAAIVDPQVDWLAVTADGALSFQAGQYTGGTQLTVPDSLCGVPVTALADQCFAGAGDLVWIQLPTTLEAIGPSAFARCTALRGVYVPGGVTEIGSYAFESCTSLEAISIPATVTSISQTAFENCPKLRYIFFDGTYSQWAELYNQFITPYTFVFCTDGTYVQGAG